MCSIKKDDVKQKWEETEFPLVCETCLGDNPYVRMTKETHGKKCKICETPFTVFGWQAGSRGRLKKVEICRTCAQTKNVCQVCIYDLQYGLPVKLRDKVLREEAALDSGFGYDGGGGGGDGGTVSTSALAVPQSDANRAWYNATNERAIAANDAGVGINPVNVRAAARLQAMARMEPRYERNLAKICSFFAKGECNRGSGCPFRHEMPRDRNDPLSKQNTKDRFHGTNDPVAEKMIGRQKERLEKRKEEAKARGEDGEGDERAVATCYVRFNHTRTDPNNSSQNESNHNQNGKPVITLSDLRDAFYSFGEISSVRMHPSNGAAFIEYTTGQAAQLAVLSMNRKDLKGHILFVGWARQPKRGNEGRVHLRGLQDRHQHNHLHQVGPIRPVAPPGSVTNAASTPLGFAPTRPSAHVLAAARARGRGSALSEPPSSSSSSVGALPRPGGGVIRNRPGLIGVRNAAPRPYYPSSDPARLGSRTNTGTDTGSAATG